MGVEVAFWVSLSARPLLRNDRSPSRRYDNSGKLDPGDTKRQPGFSRSELAARPKTVMQADSQYLTSTVHMLCIMLTDSSLMRLDLMFLYQPAKKMRRT